MASIVRSPWRGVLTTAGVILTAACGSADRQYIADGIRIDAHVQPAEEHLSLELLLSPRDGAKLASRPGIKLRPAQPGVNWLAPVPVVRETRENGYFAEAQRFSLPFGRDGAPRTIVLDIEYAYCQSDQLCIRSETTIEVPRG